MFLFVANSRAKLLNLPSIPVCRLDSQPSTAPQRVCRQLRSKENILRKTICGYLPQIPLSYGPLGLVSTFERSMNGKRFTLLKRAGPQSPRRRRRSRRPRPAPPRVYPLGEGEDVALLQRAQQVRYACTGAIRDDPAAQIFQSSGASLLGRWRMHCRGGNDGVSVLFFFFLFLLFFLLFFWGWADAASGCRCWLWRAAKGSRDEIIVNHGYWTLASVLRLGSPHTRGFSSAGRFSSRQGRGGWMRFVASSARAR